MICNNCGSKIDDDSKFCYKCGNKIFSERSNKLKPTQKLCNRCGGVIGKDAIFCYKCGNNTSGIDSDKLNSSTTENNNVQIDEVSKVKNVSNQNTEEQSYNSPNVNTQSKRIKIRRNHTLIWMCVIAILMVVVEETSSSYLANKRSVTNRMNSANSNTITETNYNGIQLSNRYINEDEGVCFNYPKSWEEDSSLASKYNSILYLKAQKGQNVSAYMGVSILNKGNNVIDPSNAKAHLEKYFDKHNIERQEMIDTKIDNVDAIKFTGTAPDSTTVVVYQYIVDGYCYQITFNALDNKIDVYEPIFDAIMKSYKITAPTENASQKQNIDDYGLSEEEALEVAQQFLDTHPLMERTIIGDVQYEPQMEDLSTKGLYHIETKAPDESRRAMWVDKRTGSVLLIAKQGDSFRDGEEVYQEVFITNQNNDEISLDGINLSEYLGSSTKSISDKYGPDEYGTDVGGSLYDNYKYLGYDGISFLYDDSNTIQRICGKPELFRYHGTILNKNRDELVEIFGTPLVEDSRYDNATGKSNYWIEYIQANYTIKFEFSSEDSDAYLIQIYK